MRTPHTVSDVNPERGVTVRLPDELYEGLFSQARREDRSMASLVRQIIRRHLDVEVPAS
jgi:predicted DNA-binding protein